MTAPNPSGALFDRRVTLFLVQGDKALDLSELQFTFETYQEDEQSPNSCSIRVFNLSDATLKKIQTEYSRVVLQAGYVNAAFGTIFDGGIIQYRIGRNEGSPDTYLDILAADGDLAYNFATINQTLKAGSSASERLTAVANSMASKGVSVGHIVIPSSGGILPRGKVLFGMAKTMMRTQVQSVNCTWSIDNGQINVIPLDGYLPGDAVVLTSATGLIGRVEQTQDGMRARLLLNPLVTVGGLVKIDNASINVTISNPSVALPVGQLIYNQRVGIALPADVATDGLYRVYVAEYKGNTRGQEWYTDIVALAVNPVTQKVKAY